MAHLFCILHTAFRQYCSLCRTLVSFSVANDPLTFETVQFLITVRRDTLSLLNFTVLNISQGEGNVRFNADLLQSSSLYLLNFLIVY